MGSQNHNMVVKHWGSLIKSGCDVVNSSNTEIILVICVVHWWRIKAVLIFNFEISVF